MIDDHCLKIIEDNMNMLVPFYIMAAYAYYVEDDPIMTDSTYDQITKWLLEYYDIIDHYHKHLISKDQLEAGTCLIKYPTIVKHALGDLREQTKIKSSN